MKIEPLSLIEADAELCTLLRRLAKGKIRKLFPSEGIDLSKLNEYLKFKEKPTIPQDNISPRVIEAGISFQRNIINDILIEFALDHDRWGDLGTIWLKSSGQNQTDLSIDEPLFPTRQEAKNYHLLELKTWAPGSFSLGPISFEAFEDVVLYALPAGSLHERRRKLQLEITNSFISILHEKGILPERIEDLNEPRRAQEQNESLVEWRTGKGIILGELEIPLPWDVLHFATVECLHSCAPGIVNIASTIIEYHGFSTFILTQDELGSLGKITLRKLSEKLTVVKMETAPRPRNDEVSADWGERLNAAHKIGKEEYRFVWAELQAEKKQLYKRRREHLIKVIRSFFKNLVYQVSLWWANDSVPPHLVLAWAHVSPNSDVMIALTARRPRPAEEVNNTSYAAPNNKGGRPHLPEDVWAWEQIHEHKRKKSEVYQEWRERTQQRNLMDPLRQFNRIIHPEWMTKP